MRTADRTLFLASVLFVSLSVSPFSQGFAQENSARNDLKAEIESLLDPSVDPCQDFYTYACGGWLAKNPLPSDKPIFSRGFSVLADQNLTDLREILDETLARHAKRSEPESPKAEIADKLGAFYGSCLDETAIERAGKRPLAPWLERIDRVRTVEQAMAVVGDLQLANVEVLVGLAIESDFKDPTQTILYVVPGGLGLPDRDDYLKSDADAVALRADYQKYVAKMLELSGLGRRAARRSAAQVMAFETALARVSLPRIEMRNPENLYHRTSPEELATLTPRLPWQALFAALGSPREISASPSSYLSGLEAALTEATAEGAEKLRSYLRYHAVAEFADRLPKRFGAAHFDFFSRRLLGQKEPQARWQRCVTATDQALGDALGQAFVDRRFAGESKTIALDMIHRIEASFGAGLPELDWMDDATRERAREKLAAVRNKIGYPDRFRDYAEVRLVRGDYFGNALSVDRAENRRQLAKVGKPVDRSEWRLSAPTVNAFYNPTGNQMVYPAGILQKPFFSREQPTPINYGAVGMAMGHELTHGFDDQGRRFDGTGQLREWWDPAIVTRFEERAQCVVDLYSKFDVDSELKSELKVDGKLTLGENIADLGGIRHSWNAWRTWVAEHPEAPPAVPGFRDEQLFFLGFGQAWCTVTSPQFSKVLARVDTHSPSHARVNGAVSQLPAFAEAFGCKVGTPMNPENRCRVW